LNTTEQLIIVPIKCILCDITMPANKTNEDLLKKVIAQFGGDTEAVIEALRQFSSTVKKNRKTLNKLGPEVISVSGVNKTYKLGRQKIEALKNVSVSIKAGEFVALTGPSGSGKSTLLQLIGGLDKPTSGDIVVADNKISRLSDRKLSIFRNRTIGFVFQFFYLQPFLKTAVNLEVPGMFARLKKTERQARAKELGMAVGLEERMNHLPKELSGGQMQRAAIARALLNRPKVLLADEPTGNLDQANGKAIIDLFELVRQTYGTTIVVVTHDKNIAALADREIKMTDGEVVS
jgi:ABC-type lipoprotein export system ATPase subunit